MDECIRQIQNLYEETIGDVQRSNIAGQKRAVRGSLVEKIARIIVECAWVENGFDISRLSFVKRTYPLEIPQDYLARLDDDIQQYLLRNSDRFYKRQVDLHVSVDGQFVMGVECKSYTENAMIKRVLIDFDLLKIDRPELDCILLQLESQLTGDYNLARNSRLGSPSTHSLMAQFPNVDLHILTLLEGERSVNNPIYEEENSKPMESENIRFAIDKTRALLERFNE